MGGVVSVQSGAAMATELFDEVGPVGTTMLRLSFAAIVLVAIWRPALAVLRGTHARDVLLYAVVFGGMNTSFYLALDRIPLGIAVTLEFVGPLGVAVAMSRHRSDLLWAGLAAVGILLFAPDSTRSARAWRCSPAGSGPPTSSWRPGSGARCPAARASLWRWPWRPSSSFPPASSPAAATCSTRASSPSPSRWRC